MTLQQQRDQRKAEALAVYNDRLAAGFSAGGHVWTIAGEERQILTAGLALAAHDPTKLPPLFGLIDRDGNIVQISTVAQGIDLMAALLDFEMTLRLRLWVIYRDIKNATRPEVVDINAEWPAKP